MGGLLDLFDFNQGRMARKILALERRVDGLEAPRNSLELQVEASQSCCTAGDELYVCQVEEDWSRSTCYPNETSIKRLINEEICKRTNVRKNTPSIVARLMGVDTVPLETKSATPTTDKKKIAMERKPWKKERNGKISVTSSRHSLRQMEPNALYHYEESDDHQIARPRPREHPQEEELQKFKKEFEAWQAARFRECSKVVELGSSSGRLFAPESTNEQTTGGAVKSQITEIEDSMDHQGLTFKESLSARGDLLHRQRKIGILPPEQKFAPSRNKIISRYFEPSTSESYDEKRDRSSTPTRIVILKPGPDRFFDRKEYWTCSSGILEDRNCMEDFLEEVKERLKCELQGKALKRGSVVRGSGIETPFSEKPSDPKQIARHIAKQVRDSVTRDLGLNLLRSESTRTHRSEIRLDGVGSPEFINRDARRFLTERLRNVLQRETHLDFPTMAYDDAGSSLLDSENFRLKQFGDSSTSRHEPVHWEIVKDQQMQTRSFRHGEEDVMLRRDLSPRKLVRSLSAPVSGTSFGKLLLEDRHILTGAHIRRKHEALENVAAGPKMRKKEKLGIKERVSNLRYFTLKGGLFGKKMQSMMESCGSEPHPLKDITSGPTVVMNIGERRIMENSTEVPPSPASVCSSSQEELWKAAEYLSPISSPDVSPGEDSAVTQAFKDISSNLYELRRQLNQLESGETEDTRIEKEPTETIEADIEDEAEAYVRDLLVASRLYDGSSSKYLTRWDALKEPISTSVFEEVEDAACKKLAKDDEMRASDGEESKKVERKMLFDLLNEALASVRGPRTKMYGLRRGKIVDDASSSSSSCSSMVGRRLLDRVWKMMREYLYPPSDSSNSYFSLESMVARSVEYSPWLRGTEEEEVNAIGKEVEILITGDLIDEIIRDINYCQRS